MDVLFSGYTENVFDAFVFQAFNEKFGHIRRHRYSPIGFDDTVVELIFASIIAVSFILSDELFTVRLATTRFLRKAIEGIYFTAILENWDLNLKFGVCIPNYGETLAVEMMRTVAVEAERLGYDSIWTTDHILMPPESGTPYEKTLESITSLAYLAAHTSIVKLGISSLILAMRNPVIAAKQLATIDQVSGGRIMLATSAGWVEEEFVHLGSDFHTRGKRLDESIKLIRKLWSQSTNIKFEGQTIPNRMSRAVFEPRPIQKQLTIWISGNSEAAMRRAILLGDAWHPNVVPLDMFKQIVADFRKLPGGEDKPICVRIGLNVKVADPIFVGPQGEQRLILSGNMSENMKIISELQTLGVSYVLVTPSPNGTTNLADQLESLRVISEYFIRK
jgi:probable F420-dependent oxidoreductase